MADSPLILKSKAFALEVIQACKELRVAKCESALINQFLRSGTSIGANIREAFYAHGKADFIAKLQIALHRLHERLQVYRGASQGDKRAVWLDIQEHWH